jgi:uncharacterized small protein (DUF1192 family)
VCDVNSLKASIILIIFTSRTTERIGALYSSWFRRVPVILDDCSARKATRKGAEALFRRF